jgi:hypothetical protein
MMNHKKSRGDTCLMAHSVRALSDFPLSAVAFGVDVRHMPELEPRKVGWGSSQIATDNVCHQDQNVIGM